MSQQQTFEGYYDQYADAIYRHCFFRVFSKATAEELMQDTFLKFWRYCEDGRTLEQPQALLYRIADNCIIDYRRKKRAASLDALLEEHPQLEPADTSGMSPDDAVLLRQVRDAIANLSERDQQMMIMRYVDDLNPKDIAAVLDVSSNAVSVQLNRLVKKLRNQLTT